MKRDSSTASTVLLFPNDPTTFDLDGLAVEINSRHELALQTAQTAVQHAREAGELLAIARTDSEKVAGIAIK